MGPTSSTTWQFLCMASLASFHNSDAFTSPTITSSPVILSRGLARESALPVSRNSDHDNNWMDTTIQMGKNFMATATMAAVLLGSPDTSHNFWMPPASWAESALTGGSSPTAKLQGTVLDEAWTLVDKYYIDRSFGGQVSRKGKRKESRTFGFHFQH
jgi:hypothetical protein